MRELDQENSVKLNVLMDLFFEQLITFATFLNESDDALVEKYADFVVYAMKKKLEEQYPSIKKTCKHCGH